MEWSFPSNNYGQINGIADPGIETFQGHPLRSLAREICQNSLDAALKGTAIVEFSCFEIEADQLPGIGELRTACDSALRYWESNKNDRAKEFFDKALATLNKKKIPILRISDYNTSGLQGSNVEGNSPWNSLIKSSGASDKGGSAGGSFGIGKWAPFACSQLHTVFYSTLDIDGIVASQGVARLASFCNESGETTQGIGYYGEERNTPHFGTTNLQPGYSRQSKETGTDIYIAGFSFQDTKWGNEVISSALEGFLFAVLHDKLIVRVNGFELKKTTLPDAMKIYKDFLANEDRDSEHADEYYDVLINPKTRKFSKSNYRGMGGLELYLLIQEGYHNKVAMIRKMGMKIFEQGGNPHAVPFAGVLYVEGVAIDSFLRKLENPAHIGWEDARYTVDPSYARKIKSEIHRFIKDSVREMQVNSDLDSVDADVGEYLPDESDEEGTRDDDRVEILSDVAKLISKKVVHPRVADSDEKEDTDRDDGNAEAGGDEDVNGSIVHGSGHKGSIPPLPKAGVGSETATGKQVVVIESTKTRVFCLNRLAGEYTLLFESTKNAQEGFLEIFQSAESGSYPVKVISVLVPGQPQATCKDNKITNLVFEGGKLLRARFSIEYSDYCSMEVKGYGNQD